MAVATTVEPARRWLHAADVRAAARRARLENFPVASVLFSRSLRPRIAAVYAVARLIDEAGDTAPGDRLAVLDLLDAELRRLPEADVPVLQGLSPLVREGLAVEPFLDLVAANRVDQRVSRYATRADLRDYCRLSAEPVGRIVLDLLGLATAERVAWSDDICAGLQVAEHLQDVGEDLAAGRIYLPAEDLDRHGVDAAVLGRVVDGTAPSGEQARVVALLAGEVAWARSLLEAGRPLVRTVPGRARLAVAGFVAGGHAALDAVLAAGADAVHVTPRGSRAALVRHLVRALR
ncbi:MAG: squalene synthase HpnC [Mycobacteriales bacterium]